GKGSVPGHRRDAHGHQLPAHRGLGAGVRGSRSVAAALEDPPRGGQGLRQADPRVRRGGESRAGQRAPQRVLRQAAGTRAPLARGQGARSLVGRAGLRGLAGHQRQARGTRAPHGRTRGRGQDLRGRLFGRCRRVEARPRHLRARPGAGGGLPRGRRGGGRLDLGHRGRQGGRGEGRGGHDRGGFQPRRARRGGCLRGLRRLPRAARRRFPRGTQPYRFV
ncbi:MAG: Putative hydrolase, partial [uncultured Rubrobacteraceae bacterium]